jgi:CBS domain containing-hemolysin-like protein
MSAYLTIGGLLFASVLSLMFSTLTYCLRDFSRAKLAEELQRRSASGKLDHIVDRASDFIVVTAFCRLLANIVVLVCVLHLLYLAGLAEAMQYLVAIVITGIITLLVSVVIPHAMATHAAEKTVASTLPLLEALRIALLPVTRLMHGIDRTVARAVGVERQLPQEQIEQQMENEILAVVEEGAKEGVVDQEERRMIESVIAFRDTIVGQAMTARPDIIALPIGASLDQIKSVVEESGHSRIPAFDGTLDKIVGVLYARDLLKHIGEATEKFDIHSVMRPAFMVPATKSLSDLLKDFRAQKVHIAIVLDEYGSTAGLITIEDVLEELVGEISDEHEPAEPTLLRRTGDATAEADARIYLDQLNRVLGLDLPEDAGYDTLGGFVSNTLGRIPQAGATFEHCNARFTILEAEPQRVKRVKIELLPEPARSA